MRKSVRVPLFITAIAIVSLIGYLVGDFFLASSLIYIVILSFSLLFWKPGGFLLLDRMQQLWDQHSVVRRTFVFEGCSHDPPKYVTASVKAILDDANLFNEAKFKYLLNETMTFVEKVTDDLRTLVFLNILLLIALIIVVTESPGRQIAASQHASSPPAAAATPGTPAGTTPHPGTGSAIPSPAVAPTNQPLRHLLSYTAIALQTTWFMRLLFHYRRKNAEVVSTVTAQSAA